MKQFYISIFVYLFSSACDAQQLTASSFYDMHAVLHNPATAGGNHQGFIGATYRTQWSNMPGSPQTALVFGNAFLQKVNIGIGGYVYNDVTGPTRRTGLQMAYAYQIQLNNSSFFSIGIEGRFQQFSFDRQKLQESIGNDPVLEGTGNRIKGDAGLGLVYSSEKFQIGTSVSQLMQTKLDWYEGTGNQQEEAKLYRHYYLHSNYSFDVDGVTQIVPNVLLIYLPNAPLEMQAGARVEHNNLLWWGLAWRARQSLMISAGLHIKEKFTVGYSFDIYTTPLSVYDKGSTGHEIILRYDFTSK
ncbi:MAG: PorP/SprF family type IX secretion system membrane protein [Chitinophagaceae bacterium]|nr:PorP/SprF family type IX secretion system membrane protein [Chitinophagaceae bacterium]